jgi:2-amino-4-hydroxy-6-hydroxymethyldihydropteridine diphosphokinase
MPTVYLGIGSNLGDREDNCRKAIDLLMESGLKVVKKSSMHETEPWGVKGQPRFINMAVETETELRPREMLNVLKAIEKRMGRVEAERYGPRIIDLDILLYDSLVIDEPDLKIPHPLMHEREFVLKPLSEIAPDVVHPVLKKTIREIAKKS